MGGITLHGTTLPSDLDDEELQAHLNLHYEKHKGTPPTCLCNSLPINMYIAKVGDRFILKRWPGSGHEHFVDCDRYEAPIEASGIGRLMGHAIEEDPSTGKVMLKLGFALKKMPRSVVDDTNLIEKGQEASADSGAPIQSHNRVSLRGTLHYIWEGARLNHWKPAMTGTRNWRAIYTLLKAYTANLSTKGHNIASRLYIPEPFVLESKDEIKMRRRGFLNTVASNKAARDLLLFLFEIKSIGPSEYGFQIVAKNVPDDRFYMSEDIYKVICKRYETELEMHGDLREEERHLVAMGTMSVKPSGSATIEDIVLMLTNENWVPVGDMDELLAVNFATISKRHFIKPLRYNVGPGAAMATMIFTDTPEKATSLFVVKPDDSDIMIERRNEVINAGRTNAVLWDKQEIPIPSDIIKSIPRIALR